MVARTRLRAKKAPQPRLGDETRAQLLAVARDLFLESGLSAFSLREVARRVGVSAAAVYRHFDGKEALVLAACMQGFQVFSSYLVRALGAPGPLPRLLATGEQYRQFAIENPLDYRFIFMSPIEQITRSERETLVACEPDLPRDTTFQFLVDRVRECMDAGALAPGEPERVAVLIWAHVHGLVALRLSGHLQPLGDDQAFAAFYRDAVQGLLRGLGP